MRKRRIAALLALVLLSSVFSPGVSAAKTGITYASSVTEYIIKHLPALAPAPSLPTLVNADNPLPRDYLPELADLGKTGYRATPATADAFARMSAAAKADGVTLTLCSAYRSYEKQNELYNRRVAAYKPTYGASAYDKAATSIARPGTSEHQLGEAIDFGSSLTSAFAKTRMGIWLRENAAEYGFILRYPENTMEITGIIFEPWHYRYVGVEHAKKIVDGGYVLEEYIAREQKKTRTVPGVSGRV